MVGCFLWKKSLCKTHTFRETIYNRLLFTFDIWFVDQKAQPKKKRCIDSFLEIFNVFMCSQVRTCTHCIRYNELRSTCECINLQLCEIVTKTFEHILLNCICIIFRSCEKFFINWKLINRNEMKQGNIFYRYLY